MEWETLKLTLDHLPAAEDMVPQSHQEVGGGEGGGRRLQNVRLAMRGCEQVAHYLSLGSSALPVTCTD